MAKSFKTAAAFKASVEHRLRQLAAERAIPLNTVRLKLVIERLLARLFAAPNPPWLLKGGYAMELRYRPRARTTRDIDLSCLAHGNVSLEDRLLATREQLQIAAAADLGDHLVFRIESPTTELEGAPLGGARFHCEASLAGKIYGRLHIDLGFGDEMGDQPDILTGDDLLSFAGIAPGRMLAVPNPQQFAEKIHAYTFPRADRVNMRTKDLVDLLLLIETESVTPDQVAAPIQATFARRKSHTVPLALPQPPAIWANEFEALAAEARIEATTIEAAFRILSEFWGRISL